MLDQLHRMLLGYLLVYSEIWQVKMKWKVFSHWVRLTTTTHISHTAVNQRTSAAQHSTQHTGNKPQIPDHTAVAAPAFGFRGIMPCGAELFGGHVSPLPIHAVDDDEWRGLCHADDGLQQCRDARVRSYLV